MPDALIGLVAHPTPVRLHIRGLGSGPPTGDQGLADVGMLRQHPDERGGNSIMVVLMSTATGFRSPAGAVSSSRWTYSGIASPPAKGSQIGGP